MHGYKLVRPLKLCCMYDDGAKILIDTMPTFQGFAFVESKILFGKFFNNGEAQAHYCAGSSRHIKV